MSPVVVLDSHIWFWWINIIAVQLPRYPVARDWLREHGATLEEDFV
ncbi:MAG: hypothetical protein WAU00_09875 [Caldilinea sp.]|nr:hypothetical protein [Anaerolineales bacterium]HQY94639.1 hypothetical protein [Caldilinea sp.]HRA65878.1 hypothetical protein [Caldilinea sp.]